MLPSHRHPPPNSHTNTLLIPPFPKEYSGMLHIAQATCTAQNCAQLVARLVAHSIFTREERFAHIFYTRMRVPSNSYKTSVPARVPSAPWELFQPAWYRRRITQKLGRMHPPPFTEASALKAIVCGAFHGTGRVSSRGSGRVWSG